MSLHQKTESRLAEQGVVASAGVWGFPKPQLTAVEKGVRDGSGRRLKATETFAQVTHS
jgi:hypothetical protein